MVIWIKFAIPVHFSSLIPEMLMFTLAISISRTTSNLPWFMDLTFQVPMQYCSLQHQTLLPPPVTSTTGGCFCFGSVSSFSLELFLHSSPVAYWAPCLENPMDGGAWWAAVHGVATSRTRLNDFTFTFMHWRRKWQPTPVFLPGESQGRQSLVGCHLWGRKESDMTEAT